MTTHRNKITLMAAAALSALVVAGTSGPASACSSQLDRVTADWHDKSFVPPAKPNQARVVGRYGHEITGGQYHYIHGQIRQANGECRAGLTASAERRAAHAQGVLTRATGGRAQGGFVANSEAFAVAE